MNTKRLHTASKRRRQVYLKKMTMAFAAMMIIAGLSISLGMGFVDAHANTLEEPVFHKYYKSIEITSGDTLWQIAEEYMNDDYDSIYDYIHELKEINNLASNDIHAGQYLTVAYYDTEFR